jgi:hypothetical protein
MEEEEGRKIAGLCGGRVTDAMRRYSKRRRIHRFHFSSSFSDWMRAEVLRSSARRRQTRQLITVLRVCVCVWGYTLRHTHNAPSSTHFVDGKKIKKSFFKTTFYKQKISVSKVYRSFHTFCLSLWAQERCEQLLQVVLFNLRHLFYHIYLRKENSEKYSSVFPGRRVTKKRPTTCGTERAAAL